jgi:hypothetical protein
MTGEEVGCEGGVVIALTGWVVSQRCQCGGGEAWGGARVDPGWQKYNLTSFGQTRSWAITWRTWQLGGHVRQWRGTFDAVTVESRVLQMSWFRKLVGSFGCTSS